MCSSARVLKIALVAMLCGSLIKPETSAQEATALVSFVVANCARQPTTFPFEGGDCKAAIGAVIVVTDSRGSLVGTCQSAALAETIAGCSLELPPDIELTAALDPTSIDSEFLTLTPEQDFTVPSDQQGIFAGPVFVNLNRALECMGACPAKIVATAEPPPIGASGLHIGSPTFEGAIGDTWDLWIDGDSFWWRVEGLAEVEKPSPRWVAAPVHSWLVVLIDMGTEDSWNSSEFPYDRFALQDDEGNVYLPDMVASSAFCAESCTRPIATQDYSMSVGVEFHQALVFDVPILASGGEGQYKLRTIDGLVEVILGS